MIWRYRAVIKTVSSGGYRPPDNALRSRAKGKLNILLALAHLAGLE
jgi:hypothetical protein